MTEWLRLPCYRKSLYTVIQTFVAITRTQIDQIKIGFNRFKTIFGLLTTRASPTSCNPKCLEWGHLVDVWTPENLVQTVCFQQLSTPFEVNALIVFIVSTSLPLLPALCSKHVEYLV